MFAHDLEKLNQINPYKPSPLPQEQGKRHAGLKPVPVASGMS